jgi:hypothetical protein
MADTVTVSSEEEFVQHVAGDDNIEITDDGASELWDIWTYRRKHGAENDVLVTFAAWLAEEKFDKRWPAFFASIEHDDPDKGAILFDGARLVDRNVYENEIWDDVTVTQSIEVVDMSPDSDHIDEQGKLWGPRSQMTVFVRDDDIE